MSRPEDSKLLAEARKVIDQFGAAKDDAGRAAASKLLADTITKSTSIAGPDSQGPIAPKEASRRWNVITDTVSQAMPGLTVTDAQHHSMKVVGTTGKKDGLVIAIGEKNGRAENFFVMGPDGQCHEAVRNADGKSIDIKEGGKILTKEDLEALRRKTAAAKPAAVQDDFNYNKI